MVSNREGAAHQVLNKMGTCQLRRLFVLSYETITQSDEHVIEALAWICHECFQEHCRQST